MITDIIDQLESGIKQALLERVQSNNQIQMWDVDSDLDFPDNWPTFFDGGRTFYLTRIRLGLLNSVECMGISPESGIAHTVPLFHFGLKKLCHIADALNMEIDEIILAQQNAPAQEPVPVNTPEAAYTTQYVGNTGTTGHSGYSGFVTGNPQPVKDPKWFAPKHTFKVKL